MIAILAVTASMINRREVIRGVGATTLAVAAAPPEVLGILDLSDSKFDAEGRLL
jgi:hypothetical protein